MAVILRRGVLMSRRRGGGIRFVAAGRENDVVLAMTPDRKRHRSHGDRGSYRTRYSVFFSRPVPDTSSITSSQMKR
jgi:hypothetical protein